ncbi:MAG: hypothetical protein FWF87_00660 [Synergistaceae bacterium]|nr:hypothetical protein [Synergistaceae bacterium]
MKRIIVCIALLFVIESVALAAQMLSEFPMGMAQKDAIAKGLVMKDQQGGVVVTEFGGKEWPTAMVFENEKLVYLILKGEGNEYLTGADYGLLGWLVIHMATDNNLVFDAIKLASSGKNEDEIGVEFEKFLDIMQAQKYTKYSASYIGEAVWLTIKYLRGDENPVEKYPSANICNMTVNGSDISLVFTTFGYMGKIK